MCWSASAAMACQASNRKHYPIDLIKHYPIDLTHLLSPFCPFPRSKPSDQNTGGTKARAPAVTERRRGDREKGRFSPWAGNSQLTTLRIGGGRKEGFKEGSLTLTGCTQGESQSLGLAPG